MNVLTLDRVVAAYGRVRVLRGVSLSVPAGKVVTLLGANGAGKTTTLRVISGLLRPSAGQVLVAGQPIDRMASDAIARLGVAHIPEGRGILRTLSVLENLQLGGRKLGAAFDDELEKIHELFPRLAERSSQQAGTLSGGEQQMLSIGRALLQQPRLLMVDELSLGLAPVVLDELFPVLPRIASGGTAVLLVEQFVGRAFAVADYAYLMEKGVVRAHGTPTELSEDREVLASAYLGA